MDILLTNDDGVLAPGLWALHGVLQRLGRVTVVAPRTEQSGVGHGITYLTSVAAEWVRTDEGAEACAVRGTPADCVKLALREILPRSPDLVVSGMNLGLNVGCNVFYSGTVAAAMEGAMNGVLSAAFSCDPDNADRLSRAAGQAVRVLELILALDGHGPDGPVAYSVNLPPLRDADPCVVFTHHRAEAPRERYLREDGDGGRRYRLVGVDEGAGRAVGAPGSDVRAVREGMISVTPLRASLTDVQSLRLLSSADAPFAGQNAQPLSDGGATHETCA